MRLTHNLKGTNKQLSTDILALLNSPLAVAIAAKQGIVVS